MSGVPSLDRIRAACRAVARRDTAYVTLERLWTPEDPLAEHCGACAYVVQQLLGGIVVSGRDWAGVRWLWNRLPDGSEISIPDGRPNGLTGRPAPARSGVNRRHALLLARVRAYLAAS